MKKLFLVIAIIYSVIITFVFVHNITHRPDMADYRPPTDNRPMQYWVICRTNSMTAKAPHYRHSYPGLENKSREAQSHYWNNVYARLISIKRLQEEDLIATTSDMVWVEEKLRVLSIQVGYVDQETWKVVGEDPEGKGINSPTAKLRRHWLTLMFLNPEAAEDLNKFIRQPCYEGSAKLQFELDRLKQEHAMLQALGRNSSPPF